MRRTYTCATCGIQEEVDDFNNLLSNHYDSAGHPMMPQFQFADLSFVDQGVSKDPTLDAAVQAILTQGDNYKGD